MPKDQRIEPLATISADAVRWMIREQPTHRALCRKAIRPCPHLLCRFHTYLQSSPAVSPTIPPTNALVLAQNDTESWERPTCQLDALEEEAIQKGQPIEPDQPVGPHPHLIQDALAILSLPKRDES